MLSVGNQNSLLFILELLSGDLAPAEIEVFRSSSVSLCFKNLKSRVAAAHRRTTSGSHY